MDYGAGYHDYKSDMTRTVCVGEPSAKQLEIYEIVQRTHEECAKAVHAGVDGKEIHELSRKIIAEAGYGAYYGHGLGHGVGIDIHELPVFGRTSNTVEEGAVITIEPGIYLPGEFGVRLEDFGSLPRTALSPSPRARTSFRLSTASRSAGSAACIFRMYLRYRSRKSILCTL